MSLDWCPHYFILFVWLDLQINSSVNSSDNDLCFKFYVHENVGRHEYFPRLPWWTGMIWNHELVSLESSSLLKYDKWFHKLHDFSIITHLIETITNPQKVLTLSDYSYLFFFWVVVDEIWLFPSLTQIKASLNDINFSKSQQQ